MIVLWIAINALYIYMPTGINIEINCLVKIIIQSPQAWE